MAMMRHKGSSDVEKVFTTPGATGIIRFHASVRRDGRAGLKAGTKVCGATYHAFVAHGFEHIVQEDDEWEVECLRVRHMCAFIKPIRLIQSGADYRDKMSQRQAELKQQRIYERAVWLISVQMQVRVEEVWKTFSRTEVLTQAETAGFQAEYLRSTGRRLDGDFYGGQNL